MRKGLWSVIILLFSFFMTKSIVVVVVVALFLAFLSFRDKRIDT